MGWLDQKVPVVAPLSRAKIEKDTLNFINQYLPDYIASPQEIDIEYIFELIIPEIKHGLNTKYIDLSYLGSEGMGYTDAKKKNAVYTSSYLKQLSELQLLLKLAGSEQRSHMKYLIAFIIIHICGHSSRIVQRMVRIR